MGTYVAVVVVHDKTWIEHLVGNLAHCMVLFSEIHDCDDPQFL